MTEITTQAQLAAGDTVPTWADGSIFEGSVRFLAGGAFPLIAQEGMSVEMRTWVILIGFVAVTVTVLLIHGGWILYRRARGGWTTHSMADDGIAFDTLFHSESLRHETPLPDSPLEERIAGGRSEMDFEPGRPRRRLVGPRRIDRDRTASEPASDTTSR